MSTSQTPPTNASVDETTRQRREIEDTRSDMGRTLERIEDRVSPGAIKDRQAERLRGRWQRARQSVMGSDAGPSARDRLSGATGDARQAVHDAPDRVQESTRGNPLAAGLIALGLGALAGSLLPTSEGERRAAGQLREELEEPVRSELQRAGQQVGGELRDDAKHAAEEVSSTAEQAAERTKGEAQESAERVKGESKEASDAGQGTPPAPPRT